MAVVGAGAALTGRAAILGPVEVAGAGAEVGAIAGAGPACAGMGEAAVTTAAVAATGARRSAFAAVGEAGGGTLVWLLAKELATWLGA